ncbi:MAG: hypothetical protein HYX42_02040 [Polaromonas sp.]|uniref:Bug family tripartite tricarboxylate transporter substrate binding protein n=1 Tax=Polaromonas sp. TaxID=1869339 RepID=UPI0025E1E9DA|nr:tripartite tricarboxylate transporter substrate-binding protein [Polaromonas sp.]MBI2725008.1 hypothetical protein [Polaromonas sp.]
MTFRRSFLSILALNVVAAVPALAQVEAGYPSRPIKIIVPYAPGATNDILPRIIAPHMAEILKQPVIVKNKPGAGGDIGVAFVAKGKPDGYTLLMTSNVAGVSAATKRTPPYDIPTELMPVGLIGNQPMLLVSANPAPFTSLQDFVRQAKPSPEKFSYGTPGVGTLHQVAFEQMGAAYGIRMIHVPFTGITQALTETSTGRVTLTFGTPASAGALLQKGSIKVLAVTTKNRLPAYPDAPTLTESGVPGMEAGFWYGFTMAAGTSAPIAAKLQDAFAKALANPEVAAAVRKLDVDVMHMTPAQFGDMMVADYRKWKKIATDANLVN